MLGRLCHHSLTASAGRSLFQKRSFATAVHDEASKLRNIAFVAHIDSGKTTLTESVLLKSSYLSSAGSVDTGSTTTDFLPAERQRGITIQSASIPVKWNDWTFNLIDTPGHADFGMEVESASRVIDGAVVLIDSVEGVEAQTKGVWRQLDRYGVGSRIMFLNKLDRPGASFNSSVLSLLAHRLHPKPMVLSLPVASFESSDYTRAEPGIHGLVDLVNWELWKWSSEGELSRHVLPAEVEQLGTGGFFPENHPLIPHLVHARTSLLDNLSMFSEKLMDRLLGLPSTPSAYLTVPAQEVLPELRAATLRNDILPVLCGSAFKHVGTELLLNYVGALLPSPVDANQTALAPNAPLRMLAWKVVWDKRKGWMTFVRVYSGTLKQQSTILNVTRGQRERISKLLLLYASQTEEVQTLSFGSVGVIIGCKYTRTGDTLTSTQQHGKEDTSLPNIVPPPPVMSISVIPQSQSDVEPVQQALESLSRTDPSVRVEANEGQIIVHGLGALHLEIVESRLRDEWAAQFEVGRQRVSYRECLGSSPVDDVPHSWSTEMSGKSIKVDVNLEVRSLNYDEEGDPAWGGNVVANSGEPLGLPDSFIDKSTPLCHVSRGLFDALSSSPNTSFPVSRLHIKVLSYSYPEQVLPASVQALAGGSAIILRNILKQAGMGPLMEPYIRVKVTVNEEHVGKIVKDLTENGGEVLDLAASSVGVVDGDQDIGPYPQDGVYIPPEELSPSASAFNASTSSASFRRSVHALAPLSRLLDYSSRLRAISGGQGVFEMENAGFHAVSETRKLEILKELGRA
ncbi:P-loop containing nucleoside triphosphate hydrolase protein [Trametopsis cervina]|nr:P-loop containing nucleoside triphosphate hydrolase protein [Trametopsis cervina]